MRSNLGGYKWMTTTAKKCGGPIPFMAGLVVLGGGICCGVNWTIKRIKCGTGGLPEEAAPYTVTVHTPADIDDAVRLVRGDRLQIWVRDNDSVLVEIVGAADNPRFVSADWLRAISDFESSGINVQSA